MAEIPGVSEWFSKKNVLITGGTGFIGKCIIEKLLRSCPDIGTIYLLLRVKKGQSVESRLEIVKKSEIFSFAQHKYDWSKVKAVEADTAVPGCDLKEDMIKELKENVNVIFHVAATVKFDEPLLHAVNVNARITYDMVELSKNMKNLEIFVHVSTAFSNSDRLDSDEIVYPPTMDWRNILSNLTTLDERGVNALTPKILGTHPNTYTFTKQIAERIVWDHRDEIPILIFRPVIVTSTMYEPAIGWSDNFSGPELLMYLVGKGFLRATLMDQDNQKPHCPVDITANTAITAAWKAACYSKIRQESYEEIISSTFYLTNWRKSWKMGRQAIKEHPIPNIVWTHHFIECHNETRFLFCHLLFNLLPALFFQLMAKLAGKKVTLIKAFRKLYITMILLKTFVVTPYSFKTDNHDKLYNALSDQDKERFNIRIFKSGKKEANLEDMYQIIKTGLLNMYICMGDGKVSKEVGLRRQKLMLNIDRVCRIALLALAVWFFPFQKLASLFSNIFA